LELSRRQATSKTKVFVKLFFNGKEVVQSASKPVSDDFVVPYGHIFPLRIVQWPESLRLQIHEGSTLRTTLLAEISLPLCDSKTTLDKTTAEPISFKSSNRVKHDHRGVGSNVDFSANIEGSETRSEPIRGKVFVRIGWAKTSDGVILAPPPEQWNPPASSKR
jgi:coiled-coil and C2 domain-containing protein 2A